MAEFRRGHSRSRGSGAFAGRMAVFLVGLVILIVVLGYVYSRQSGGDTPKGYVPAPAYHETEAGERNFLPTGGNGIEVVHHAYYSLGYQEKHEQAAWVSYELTDQSLYVPNVKRSNWFGYDDQVSTHSAAHKDYSNSGYTRGHMAPAGDMAFNKQAMEESFLMSNMSPQLRGFNNGIWKELEENTRDWAIDRKELYIVTGPIFKNASKVIGKNNKITVPTAFYRVAYDYQGKDSDAIAYIIPHKVCDEPLSDFEVSIDEVEAQTGLDLFSNLSQMDGIESRTSSTRWPLNQAKYRARVDKWNHE